MCEYTIRQAVPEDAKKLSQLIRRCMQTYRRESGISESVLESLHESVETVADRIGRNRCLCYFDGDEPVGTITLARVNNPMRYSFSTITEEYLSNYKSCVYISRFAVDDDLRGTGLGVKLMQTALSEPEALESGLAMLHTAVANRRMHEFYHNRGFVMLDSENSRGYERGLYIHAILDM